MKIPGIFVDGKDLTIHLSFSLKRERPHSETEKHSLTFSPITCPRGTWPAYGLALGGKSGHITGISEDMTNLRLRQVAGVQARSPQGWGACHGWPIIQCVLLVPSWLSRTRIVISFIQRSFCPTTRYRSGALGIRSPAKCPANFNTTVFLLMLPNIPDSGNVQWDQKMIHPVCILAVKRHQGVSYGNTGFSLNLPSKVRDSP